MASKLVVIRGRTVWYRRAAKLAAELSDQTGGEWRVRRKYGLRLGYEVFREVDLPEFPEPPYPFFKDDDEQADRADVDVQVPPYTL